MYREALPAVVGAYAGDTAWSAAVYFTLGLLFPASNAWRLALATAAISLGVELSQLAHPAWLDAFRRKPGVGLLLGYDFVASDLACYAAGTLLAFVVDRSLASHRDRADH